MAIQGVTAVIPGLYRGPAPDPSDIPILKKVWGINKIVSLDADSANKIADAVKKEEMEHVIIPIDSSIAHESEPIRYLKRNLRNVLTANSPVYVHCTHGADRTGLAVALFRRQQGWPCDVTMREARTFGFGIRLAQPVRNYYISLICSNPDKNTASDGLDAVSKVRQNLDDAVLGDTVIGESSSRQSFSPITPNLDYPSSMPEQFSKEYPTMPNNYSPDSLSADDKKKRKQKLRRMYLEDLNDAMAQVGGFQNCNPILRGIGPIEPCGIMPCGYSWAM